MDPFSAYGTSFEIRTYRLCRRILIFYHFLLELSLHNYLVSSINLTYEEIPTLT